VIALRRLFSVDALVVSEVAKGRSACKREEKSRSLRDEGNEMECGEEDSTGCLSMRYIHRHDWTGMEVVISGKGLCDDY
jgi:hypothetical protein